MSILWLWKRLLVSERSTVSSHGSCANMTMSYNVLVWDCTTPFALNLCFTYTTNNKLQNAVSIESQDQRRCQPLQGSQVPCARFWRDPHQTCKMSDTGQKMSKTCQNIRTSQTSGQALNSRHGHVHFVAPLRCSALFRPVPPCSSDDALDSTTISSTDLPSGSSNLMAHLETHLTCRATMSNLNISKHI